ncbi:MAG: hypothetical protein R3F23_01510 [Verrucomicrobiia bacterium]
MANFVSGKQIRLFRVIEATRKAKAAALAMSEAVGIVGAVRRAKGIIAVVTRSRKTKEACEKASQTFDDLVKKLDEAKTKAGAVFDDVLAEASTVADIRRAPDDEMVAFRRGFDLSEQAQMARGQISAAAQSGQDAINQIERARAFALDAAAKLEKAAKSGLAEDFAEAEAAAVVAMQEAEWAETYVESAARAVPMGAGIAGFTMGDNRELKEAAEIVNPFAPVVSPEKQDQWIDELLVPAAVGVITKFDAATDQVKAGDDGRGNTKLKAPPQREPLPEICRPLPSLTSESPEKPSVPGEGTSDEVWAAAAGKQQSVEAFTEDRSIGTEPAMSIGG